MDITAILPPTNKAGNDLINILEQDGKQKEFKKIVGLMASYTNVNKHLLARQVTMQYVYDAVYRDYIEKIKTKFEQKYSSYVLNILHKKYVDFLIELRKILELCEEQSIISNNEDIDKDIDENIDEND